MVDAFQDFAAERPMRKKFAKPPVKVACLPCRASRTRCGGQEPCSNCVSKNRKCSYLPSKRGGPRKKKQKASPSPEDSQEDAQYAVVPEFEEPAGMFSQIDVLSAPGAGLRHLDFTIPSSMFQSYLDDGNSSSVQMEPVPSPLNTPQCFVRTYGSEPEILNAYYDFIHSYFPLLPPRTSPPCRDRPLHCPISCSNPSAEPLLMYRPRSPLSLAVAAVLALIPHPADPEPTSPMSISQRRTYAHAFAQLANSIIEAECDLELSATDPGQALSSSRPPISRERLHPRVPEDLETLLALLILSVYEYAQRGNLLKMRYRAGQALALALDKSLHAHVEENEFSEARRRAWWMTYYCVVQGSIVSTTPPTIVINDPQFTTPYPHFSADSEGWSILIQAQQVLVSATQFIDDLNKCLSSQSGMQYMHGRMQQLDSWTNSVLAQTDLLPIASLDSDFGDQHETITAHCIRSISRIKLSSAQIKIHRFRAFSDIPLFIKRHCDLTAANSSHPSTDLNKPSVSGPAINNVSCPCSNPVPFQRATSTEYMTPSDSSTTSDTHPYIPQYPFASGFPYSSQHSAKICLNAAIVISRMFETLPYPHPLYSIQQQRQHHQSRPLPRTLPSFACCLMQSSYAMFMIFYKARVAKQFSPDSENDLTGDSIDRLVEELRQGLLRIIGVLSNYSLAFEALDGMRDEIQGAFHTAFPASV